MRILVISSCTGSKKHKRSNQPKCKDLSSKNDIPKYLSRFQGLSCPAVEMYTGQQHVNIRTGVNNLNSVATVDFHIISAGLGLLESQSLIPPYECSFTKMRKRDILERSRALHIDRDVRTLVEDTSYDLIYLALGRKYLDSLYSLETTLNTLTIAFSPIRNPNVVVLKANNDVVYAFGQLGYWVHGTMAFKGDLLRIWSEYLRTQPTDTLSRICVSKQALIQFFDRVYTSNILRGENGNA